MIQLYTSSGFPLPDVYRKFLAWTDAFNLDLGWLLSLGCFAAVDFYQKLLITTLGPFMIAAVLLCTHTFLRYKDRVQAVVSYTSQHVVVPERTARLEKALAQHHLIFIAMTFLIYSTVSTVIFQTFAGDPIDDDADVKLYYLRADYSIQCYTPEHKLYQAYAAVMILIYPIGIPLLYTWLLWRQRHKLIKDKDESGRALDRHADTSLTSTKFLWKKYRHQMYYWEVAECVRRLLLTGAIVFIAPGTTAQAAISCILAVISMAVAMQCKPHASYLDGYLYIVGALIIFFSMFMSLAMKTDISKETNESQDAFAVVLIIMNAFMIGATIVRIILVGRKAYDFKNGSNNNSNSSINNDNNNDSTQTVAYEEQQQTTSEVRF
jgi:hypothetical protein